MSRRLSDTHRHTALSANAERRPATAHCAAQSACADSRCADLPCAPEAPPPDFDETAHLWIAAQFRMFGIDDNTMSASAAHGVRRR
jgi:hypothetical protein